MKMYKILMELNRKIICGKTISKPEKEEAISIFLNGICNKEEIL